MKAFLKRCWRLIAMAAVAAFVVGLYVGDLVRRNAADQCVLIHQPKDGCPEGYEPSQTTHFTDAQGNPTPACWTDNPKAPRCVDALQPGESIDMQFDLEIPSQDAPQVATAPKETT